MDSNAANGGSLIGGARRPVLERNRSSRPSDPVQGLAAFLVNPLQPNNDEARARFSTRALPNGGNKTPQTATHAAANSEEEDKDMIFSEESTPKEATYDL